MIGPVLLEQENYFPFFHNNFLFKKKTFLIQKEKTKNIFDN